MTNLLPTYTLGTLDLTAYPYAVEFGGDHGAPETREELVESLLADGDIVAVSSYGNRELSLVVHVEGADLADVAVNEAALRAECAKVRNTLTVDPGDGFGVPSVFETFTASMRFVKDDDQEMAAVRRWELTIPAAPFARSADMVTVEVPAPPPSGTPVEVVLHDCDTTTGWSASGITYSYPAGPTTAAVAVTDGGDYVSATVTGGWPSLTITGTFASVSLTTTPYVVVEFSGVADPIISLNGARAYPVVNHFTSGGRVKAVFYRESPVTSVSIQKSADSSATYATVTINVHSITATDTLPYTTTRQIATTVFPGGTERTPCSIQVASPDGVTPLGLTIVHTSPESGTGYTPSLRRWRTAGNTPVVNADTISGATELIYPNAVVTDTPIAAVPTGAYLLCAQLMCSATGLFSIDWTMETAIPTTGEGAISGTTDARFWTANSWHFIPLGLATLPTVQAAYGSVRTSIHYPAGVEAITVDEWWIFRVDDDAALTVVGSYGARVWLDSPSIDSPTPRVWVGDAEDRSDARHPGINLSSMGNHVLHPNQGTATYVAVGDVDYPDVTSTHFTRWHSNVAE